MGWDTEHDVGKLKYAALGFIGYLGLLPSKSIAQIIDTVRTVVKRDILDGWKADSENK